MMGKILAIICCACITISAIGSSTVYADVDHDTFTPYRGYLDLYEEEDDDDNEVRYADFDIKWDNSDNISEFNSSTDTYEQEIIFYNYNDEAYATSYSSYQSDLPDAYADTQFCDDDDEAVITVGTTSADEIEAGEYYYVNFTLSDYEGDSCKYKVQCQEGRYYIVGSTWTTFSQTTSKVIPFHNDFITPDYIKWRSEVEPNDESDDSLRSVSNAWVSGVLDTTSDVDFWKIRLSGDEEIRFISPDGTDYDVTIYDSDGDLVKRLLSTNTEQVITDDFDRDMYYIKIYSFSGSSESDRYYLYNISD